MDRVIAAPRRGTARRARPDRKALRRLSALLVALMVFSVPVVASAATTIVHPQSMAGWSLLNEDLNGDPDQPSGSFVNGPADPPAGNGSFRQQANTGDKQTLQTTNFNGTSLAGIQISFDTYTTDTAPTILTSALNLSVDTDGDGASNRTFVYEPYEQALHGGQATQSATWQTWEIDGDTGVWWVTSAPYGIGGPRKTLDQWRTELGAPAASIALLSTAPFRIVAGSTGTSWPNFDGNVDGVTVNGTTYDFETSVTDVDCGAITDDLAAVQAAVTNAVDGTTIRLSGTCDFSAAPAHGGDHVSIENAAVLIRPGSPIDGLTIQSLGAPQAATVLGSGVQAAFVVAPGNDDVTIRGLRFVNVARAVVAINTDDTLVGSADGMLPSPAANRIIGGATMESAILGLAIDRTVGEGPGVVQVAYGATPTVATFTGQATGALRDFTVAGNYISFNPPGTPDADSDVMAIDVRQRFQNVAERVVIRHNAVGMFATDFPISNMAGIMVHSYNSVPTAGANDYLIRDVTIEGNNLGRLEELDSLPSGDVNAGDIHASGRIGILLIGVGDFDVSGNGVRSRLSSTGIPMPGGGIVAADSGFGRISGNGIIVVPGPGTTDSDLGAIGVVNDYTTAFAGAAKLQSSRDIVIRGNIVGIVNGDGPLGAQRGIVVNGSSSIAADNNNLKFTSDDALNIGVLINGPGSVSSPGPIALPRTVTASVLCGNTMAGVADDPSEVTFGGGASSTGSYFPGGSSFGGNFDCQSPPVLVSTSPANGASVTTANAAAAAATYNRDLLAPPGSTVVLRDKTATPVAGTVALTGPTSVSGGKRSITFTPAEPLTELASPYAAEVTATSQGSASTINTFSFTIDNTAPVAPVISSPANASLTNAQPLHVLGTAEGGATVQVLEGVSPIATTTAAANGSFDATLPYAAENGVVHTITARATDAAGNQGPASTAVTFTHDSVAPGAPTMSSPADGLVTSSTTITVSGTATEPSEVLVFDGDTQVGTAISASPWSTNVTISGEGEHTLTAKSEDAAGNLSDASAPVTITVDTEAPASPTVTVAPNPASIGDTTLDVSGDAEPGSSIHIEIDDDANPVTPPVEDDTTASGTGAYSFTGLDVSSLDDGDLSVAVTSSDGAVPPNETTTTVIVGKDTVAPAAPSVTIAPDPVNAANQTSVTVSGSGEAGATAGLTVTTSGGAGTYTASTTVDGDGDYAFSFDASSLQDGTLSATVLLTDPAGNDGAPASDTALKDTVAPGAPAITTPAEGSTVTSLTFGVGGTAESDALVDVFEGASLLGSATGGPTGTWSMTITIAAGDGARTIQARQTDAAGNQGTLFDTQSFILNTAAPSVLATDPVDGATVNAVNEVRATYDEQLSGGTMEVRNAASSLVAGVTSVEDDTVTFTPLGGSLPAGGSPYSVETTGTDLAATTSGVHEFTFTIDVTAPAEPVITAPAEGATLSSSSVVISGTAEAGAGVEVTDTGGSLGSTTADGAGAWSMTRTLADGSHSLTATATDIAGNTSGPSAARTFTVDTTPPGAPTITTPAAGAKHNTAGVTVSGTAEANAAITISEGATLGTTVADGSGAWSKGLTFGDGSHTIGVTATDTAGNTGPAATRSFSVDTVTPGVPSITTPTEGAVLGSTSVSISGTAEAGALVRVYEGAGEIAIATANGSGAWSVTHTFAGGAHTIRATATDDHDNTGAPSADRSFTVDTTAPAAPVITAPAEGTTLNTASVTISGTAEAGSTVKVREAAVVIETAIVDGAGTWSVPHTFGDGTHTIDATATDAGGNESAPSINRQFTIDTIAPAAPVITAPADGSTIANSIVTITGTAEPGSTVTVSEGVALGSTTAAAGGGWSMTRPFTPGSHTISATATDPAGNESAATTSSFTVTPDTTAPDKPVIATPGPGSLNGPTVTISGTAEASSTVTVSEGSTAISSVSVDAGGNWSLVASFPTGSHTITATARDAANNVSLPSDPRTFEVDANRPSSTITTADGTIFAPGDPFTIEGTASDNKAVARVDVEYYDVLSTRVLTLQVGVTLQPDGSYTWTATADGILPGRYQVRAYAVDTSGNRSVAATKSYITLNV